MRKSILFLALSGVILAGPSLYAEDDDDTPLVTTASPRGGNYNGPVTVTLTVNEKARTYYCTGMNCTPSTRYSLPLRFTSTTTLRYYSVRWEGPREQVKSQTYTITAGDTTPPVTTATPAGGSFSGAVTVALSSNEPATTYYCLGSSCSPTTVYSASLRFTTTTTMRYYSRDSAGNSESVRSQTYTMTAGDTTPPVTTATPAGGSFSGAVTVALSSNEPATTYYCLGTSCSPTSVYSASLRFTTTTTMRYYSRDSAGNSESVRSQTYTITAGDTTPPVTTATPAGGSFPGAVTVALSSNEPATTYYCLGTSCSPTTVYSASLQFSATTTLRYYSRDTAGNSEATKSQTYTMQTQACTPEPVLPQHSNLSWTGSYEVCAGCHADKVSEVLNSTHYQWKGSAAEMVAGSGQQGKIVQVDGVGAILPGTSAMNAYCINILGNWSGCSSCHVGLGAQPTTTAYNVDCLVCHQKQYKRKKVNGVFQPDTANMCISMDTAVQTVHLPTRENCVQCHSNGGGGDNYKRGDLAVAHASTTDTTFDRHMSTAGGNLRCQSCHVTAQHKIAGRGSDLRPLDSNTTVTCTNCHADQGRRVRAYHSGCQQTCRASCLPDLPYSNLREKRRRYQRFGGDGNAPRLAGA